MSDKWEFYKDTENHWRWRCSSPNGNIVGASTQGYRNKADCEGNARRNGWNDNLTQETSDQMRQKNVNAENKKSKDRASALDNKHGPTDGDNFVVGLAAEKQAGKHSGLKHEKKTRNILLTIVGILCVIVAILLISLFRQPAVVNLSQKSLSNLKALLFVPNPKENEKVVRFSDIYFGYDQSTLSNNAKELLKKNVQTLKENPQINVRTAGYTSAKGTVEINQILSEERARAVRDYLIKNGIAPERVTVIGYGRTKPALYESSPDDIDTKEAKANMRVLFEIAAK